MPSRKGKGRQSLGFGSKSQRAQFHHEWQARLQEDYYSNKRKKLPPQQERTIKISQKPPQVQNSLRRLIAERQYWDRVEDRSWIYGQQQKRLAAADPGTSSKDTSPPGWLLYYGDDSFGSDYYNGADKFPTLQSLALHSLAKALPDYLRELGVEQLHNYLALLPGPALSVLSVLTCQSGDMTNRLCRALGQHSQLTRFSLVACPKCEETDPNWKELQPNSALRETLLPKQPTVAAVPPCGLWGSTIVPDCWEDLVDQDDEEEPYTSITPTIATMSCQLQRLELGNLPLLEVEVVQEVLLKCGHSSLTHLGLSGSLLYYDRGPDVLWQLAEWVPHLQVLDVSGNSTWVTEPVLRSVYESYQALWESKRSSSNRRIGQVEEDEDDDEDDTETTVSVVTRSTTSRSSPHHQQQLLIKATGCLVRSSQILMEMEFGTLF